MERCILHADCNNFYASVECRLDPALKSFPVAVCGDVEERHGIVLAKNYKAKDRGVMTGETVWQAKRKCPGLVTVPPHYDEYMKFSAAAREIYSQYTELVEPFGMDECWLDCTASGMLFGDGRKIADRIRKEVKHELGITISVGVSFNKVFAKLGSDMKKPDAVTEIPKASFRDIIFDLPATDMLGVGPATGRKLSSAGIETIGDIAIRPCGYFTDKLGVCGTNIWRFANGLDNSEVRSGISDVPEKSVGHGITTLEDLVSLYEIKQVIYWLTEEIGHRLFIYNRAAKGISVSLRYDDMSSRQWQCKLDFPVQSSALIAKSASELLKRYYESGTPVRAVTVRAINLVPYDAPYQTGVFFDGDAADRQRRLDEAVEKIRGMYGKEMIKSALVLNMKKVPGHDNPDIIMPGYALH